MSKCRCDYCESSKRDFVRGAVPVEDFYTVPPHRKKSKKKRPPKKKGCPENNFGSHVYVWIDYDDSWLWYSKREYEIKVCCGCLKRANTNSFRRKMNDTS